jgi:hypothetical protein
VEHVSVGVVHESGWCIGVYAAWTVVLENVNDLDIEPRHLQTGRNRRRVLNLMRAAAQGDLATLEAQAWEPGYQTGSA